MHLAAAPGGVVRFNLYASGVMSVNTWIGRYRVNANEIWGGGHARRNRFYRPCWPYQRGLSS